MMRKMVYSDIVELFAVTDATLRFRVAGAETAEEAQLHRRAHHKLVAPRMSEDYIIKS
jgi:hypothetical protein